MIANMAYYAAVVSGLAMGYAHIGWMITKGPATKLDFTGYDTGMTRAFLGSNFLFSKIDKSSIHEEHECHDKAMEQTQASQAEYS